jgi:hypothetical protein
MHGFIDDYKNDDDDNNNNDDDYFKDDEKFDNFDDKSKTKIKLYFNDIMPTQVQMNSVQVKLEITLQFAVILFNFIYRYSKIINYHGIFKKYRSECIGGFGF